MSQSVPKETFGSMYAGRAPWDIDGPQPAFVAVKDRIVGVVLDAGCGTGENALYFASLGRQVTGIDYLEVPIQRAKEKAAQRNIKVTFRVHDALKLSEVNERFDSVIDSGLFHVFSDDDRLRYVGGLAHVLNAGGRVFLLCFSDQEPGAQGPRRVSEDELRASFRDGWVVESIEPSRFQVVANLRDFTFSEGGPKAWLAVVRRQA